METTSPTLFFSPVLPVVESLLFVILLVFASVALSLKEKSATTATATATSDEVSAVEIQLKQSPAEQLPVEESSVHVVTCTNAFHFFRDKARALQEMKRVLKTQGTLCITDWCNDYWIVRLYHWLERIHWSWRFFEQRYPGPLTKSELLELVQQAGFQNVEIVRYRVRVFYILFWGMQTVTATKT
jgi:ubiquinone/menaquinone biosynthesis C-methylase UbiE